MIAGGFIRPRFFLYVKEQKFRRGAGEKGRLSQNVTVLAAAQNAVMEQGAVCQQNHLIIPQFPL